ncbi:MAG: fibronectin type III domain-containing protein [Anaerolineales bacterium]
MKTRWLIVLAFGLLFLLVGCGGGTPEPYCDPASLASVNLVDPVDGGQFILGQSELQWAYASSTCDPEGYRAEVSTDSTFATGVLGATTTYPNSMGWPIPLTAGTTYYWRVRATVGSAEGPWSQVHSFHVVLPCDVSALVAPDPLFPDEGHEFWYDAPSYQWLYPDPACSPEGYHLEVSSDPAFGTLDIDLADDDPSTLRVPTANLTNCTVYYWRVAGRVGGVDGPFSSPLSFYVNVVGNCPTNPCPMTGLLAPDPVDPNQYEVVTSLTPTLTWDYPGFCEPEGYALRLGTSHDLSGLPLQGGTGIGESWTTASLQPGTQYWWDVAAIVPPAMGPFSSARTFLTGPECASSSALGVPEILSPINGEEVNSLFAWLHYQATPFGCIPDGWALDLQTDSNFAGTNLLGTYNFPGTTVITDELADCTTYYWRVAAVQDNVQGAWSNTGSFFTNDAGNCAVSYIPEFPMAVPLIDIPCYAGPGIQYDIRGYFLTGDTAPVFAQSLAGDWLVIENPDAIGTNCWVLGENVETEGDVAQLPRWEGPDLQMCTRSLSQDLCEEMGGIYHPPSRITAYTPGWCECP